MAESNTDKSTLAPGLDRENRGVNRRVILADRHLGMLGGVHGLLHGLFEAVVMVADERSLADVVATLDPDLVVVDLSLAEGREPDIAGRILEHHTGLRLVVLGVDDEPTVAGRVLAAGAAGYVLKRSAATDLVPAVCAAVAGGTYVSPAVREFRGVSNPYRYLTQNGAG